MSPALTPSRGSAPAGNGWILHLQRATNKFCRKPKTEYQGGSIEKYGRGSGKSARYVGSSSLSKPYLGWSNMARFSQGLFLMCSYPHGVYSQLLDFKVFLIFLYWLKWNFYSREVGFPLSFHQTQLEDFPGMNVCL